MSMYSGRNMLNSALYGLSNTYSILAKNSENGGLTLEDITNPSKDTMAQLGYNMSFAQYLSSNFAAIDKDGDGKISQDDMNNLTSKLSRTGLSYQEICQLCYSGQMGNSSLTNTVLNYFDKIDKNNDGRVNDAEIQAFSMQAGEEKLKTEYQSFKPSSMSVFYSDEEGDGEPSSLVDTLYPQDET